ncbi:hypothetical protein, conserved [Trypanosoma brucei brucei TREU927]|uniref:Golgi pH regulator conserved domain-containing protein n=1 Tax=Trypanosoma brucei brucei (strain 927/4 GUTat10.1) TaxID=185431 RepID=Q580H0_TRYB2|nr:hypothetical protein, conserved [Trypanosoma brucei brucei TREU927]AAX79789.1 hypothetical protein, conserved [Trypanosoma brucei]AAZ12921.1 hypothetical protein, conserved [Trypanosoma brucei brucei TREU927]
MLLKLGAVLLLLVLYHVGSLFSRLVFVYTIQQGTTKFCFRFVFALSTYAFILLLLDASQVSERIKSNFSIQTLRCVLAVDLVLIALFCPFLVVRSLLPNVRLYYFFLVLLACGLVKMLFGASVAAWSWTLSSTQGIPTLFSWDVVSVAVSTTGVVVVGLLSGYAAVTTPLAFVEPLFEHGSGDQARLAVGVLAKRQKHLLELWMLKRQQIARAYGAVSRADGGRDGSNRGSIAAGRRMWNWVANSIYSSVRASGADIAAMETESDGIRAVSMAVFLQMSEMDTLVRSAGSGETWRRRFNALFGLILFTHALVKFLSTVISLLRWGVLAAENAAPHREDTATKVMNFLEAYGLATPHGDGAEQRVVWVSIALNAWMIASAIRGFFLLVFRLTTHIAFISLDTTVTILTAGMGAFFVGQLVLLRLTPSLERESVLYTALREQLPQHGAYCHLNDLVFVVAAALVAMMRRCMFSSSATALCAAAD